MLDVMNTALTVGHTIHHRYYLADTPSPGNAPLPGNTETQLDDILGWVKWLGLAACIAGLFLVGGRMALSHNRGQGGEHMASLGYVGGGMVIIGSAAAIVSFLTT
jgi:hypothetical protein